MLSVLASAGTRPEGSLAEVSTSGPLCPHAGAAPSVPLGGPDILGRASGAAHLGTGSPALHLPAATAPAESTGVSACGSDAAGAALPEPGVPEARSPPRRWRGSRAPLSAPEMGEYALPEAHPGHNPIQVLFRAPQGTTLAGSAQSQPHTLSLSQIQVMPKLQSQHQPQQEPQPQPRLEAQLRQQEQPQPQQHPQQEGTTHLLSHMPLHPHPHSPLDSFLHALFSRSRLLTPVSLQR